MSSPKIRDKANTSRRQNKAKISPIANQVCKQGQKHVSNCESTNHQSSSHCAIFGIDHFGRYMKTQYFIII